MKRRYFYMDLLNILATFAVVMLHGSSFAFTNNGGDRWYLSVFIQVFFIFAVPLFFMISGANILDYRNREDTRTFFKKRFRRVAIPFVFWTVIWFIYNNVQYNHYSWLNVNTYARLLNGFMHGTVQPIFWYFYIIIGFYLSAPLLTKIVTVNQKALVQYLLVLNIIVVGLIGYYYQLRNQDDSSFSGGISVGVAGSIGLFVLGWYLQHYPLADRQRHLLYLAGMLSVLIMIGLALVLSKHFGEFQRQTYSIWGIFGMTWSATVFVFFQHHFSQWNPSPKVQRWLRAGSSASLGVYVLHYFFVETLEVQFHLAQDSFWHLLVMPIVVWLVVTLLVKAIQKIPYLRRTV